ncbi:hypothetical protein BDW42DRAFT_23535 [Aspergillus taichungensis]|uniref:Zn(2)-C6 fungal-type domain-containing protein n=1 Tax=Aspergillus taichungensis TaxID=482145 RepID=A0A2J5HH11_9EURO|nr:hypothetical protein BDW42DRAFT_23535 [Aspergillus taichungensis]
MARPNQRHACDRCHGQKLRCIHSGSGPCARCAKAKATCSWSKSGSPNQFKKQRPQKYDVSSAGSQHVDRANEPTPPPFGAYMSQPSLTGVDVDINLLPTQFLENTPWAVPTGRYPSPASQELESYNVGPSEADVPAAADWMWPATANGPIQNTPPANWQQTFNQEWAMMELQHPVSTMNTPSRSPPVSDTVDAPKKACHLTTIRELSDLNVDLYAHEASVPKPPANLDEPISWKNKDFAIDRTFYLSQRLIEIVNKRYPRYLKTARMQTPESTPGSTHESGPSEPPIDQGSCLLILSCYTRLIETYDRIFANMQGCLDRSSVTARDDYVNMPSVQVGSFSLPHSSSLQIVLILQLARQLLTRMGEIIKAVQPEERKNHSDASGSESAIGGLLLSRTLDTVSAEEDSLMKRITKLRSTLIELNIL